MRYVCLMRGVNVGGKTKVVMADLRAAFEHAGFEQVSTYINSGNVLFTAPQAPASELIERCERLTGAATGLDLRVTVVSHDVLRQVIAAAPDGWGDDERRRYHVLFVRPPATAAELLAKIAIDPDVETLAAGPGVLYWDSSVERVRSRSTFASKAADRDLTARNQNTVVKLDALLGA